MFDYGAVEMGYRQGFYDRVRGSDSLDNGETDCYAEGYRQGWEQAAEHPIGGKALSFEDYAA